MTLNDIKNEVSSLLFESDREIDNIFIHAVNRALRMAYSERCVIDTLNIIKGCQSVYLYRKNIHGGGGENIEYTLPRGTFSLYISGSGAVKVEAGQRLLHYPFTSECYGLCQYIDEDFTLTVTSDFPFTIHSIFHTESNIKKDEAPNSLGEREYRLHDIRGDFGGPVGVARDEYNRWIKSSRIMSGVLYVPYNYTGQISLDYKVIPPTVSLDFKDEELDIRAELTHLIPWLTAAFLSLDDDEARASQYFSLYRSGMSALISGGRDDVGVDYIDRLGWC